jgi:hypothetical protein
MRELPELESVFSHHRERLQGIRDWSDMARIGRSNLNRVRSLLAEEALAAITDGESFEERRIRSVAIEQLSCLEQSVSEHKPCLPRLRVELFRRGDLVRVYLGDTPGCRGWTDAIVIAVDKAHRPEWNDGSANAGYHWRVTLQTADAVLTDGVPLRCSTSEPRVLLAWEYSAVVAARLGDPEFFRIFVANATRAWTPIWCLERGLQLSTSPPDVAGWF